MNSTEWSFKGVDLVALSKLTSQQLDNITCLECCKNYIAPETAPCGHTLCHCCWLGRKTCPLCTSPVARKLVKLNLPLQKLTEHVQTLGESFEHIFNVKLDEFLLDAGDLELKNDPSKDVTEWLTSSQNHFSAPVQSSELSSQEFKQNSNQLEISSSKIQVHTKTKKTMNPEKVICVLTPQDDWDKIETSAAEEIVSKNKENIIGPMDIEPFYIDDNEYSTNNPRRSSRKRELKNNDDNLNTKNNNTLNKENAKESTGEVEKKSNNSKQNWNNVKKMKKEFSKLNKINRNKLNVSIEMCKTNQNTAKTNVSLQNAKTLQPQVYEIDENTPTYCNNIVTTSVADIENTKADPSHHHINNDKVTYSNQAGVEPLQKAESKASNTLLKQVSKNNEHFRSDFQENTEISLQKNNSLTTTKQERMPFYKRSALCDTSEYEHTENNATKSVKTNLESNSNSNDDIEISIKVGNTITNIIIKNKNDVQSKVTAEKEVQTSVHCPQKNDIGFISSQTIETRNVAINIDSNSNVNIEHKNITEELKEKKTISSSLKSASAKKNTASADTGTAQFEITESVEKELSNIMECAEIDDQNKTDIVRTVTEKISQRTPTSLTVISQRSKTPKEQLDPDKYQKVSIDMDIQEDIDNLNDMDIFESDNITENQVQILKNVRNTTPSEILISTAHYRNKPKKNTEKRNRETNDEELPTSKKQKSNNYTTEVNKTDITKQSKHQPESEPLNYDSIMGKVFASIDADMEEIKSQNYPKKFPDNNATNIIDSKDKITSSSHHVNQETQKQSATSGKYANEKESENIFSVVEKDDVIEASSALKNDKEPPPELQPNIEDFLTPVMSKNQEAANAALVDNNVIEIVNDDSESVVEDTPQKNTSFGKLKQKSICLNSSQRINARESIVTSGKTAEAENSNTVVNLVNTSAEMKSTNNVTVIETFARNTALETPLNINKFVDQIKHNSTPVARKSLNFQYDNLDDTDAEQTLCPTNNDVVNTTQEKEFLQKAFEKTPTTQIVKPSSRVRTLCVAGSCLSIGELAKLKVLCSQHKWSYVDKYTKDITHLVVGVDEENKSQRSVKYMCALAASKWIVSNKWVDMCLQTKRIVSEDIYEALDSTGEPGPRRSRVANKKLFQGIKFYCMEPFSILDVGTLKEILESSGGRVVSDVREVRVTDKTPGLAILLAEPENTQEDRFVYLAMQLSIVPVNFEWVLNCLGSYTLGSIQELLLCPSELLPKATVAWPPQLIAREHDEK